MMAVAVGNKHVSCEACEMISLCRPLKLGEFEMDLTKTMVKRHVLVKRGEYLFRNGASLRSIYAIGSGSFKLTVPAEPDQDRVIDFRFSGELLGMEGIHSGHHCNDALAMEDCNVCELPYQALSETGLQIPMLQERIIRLMSEELAHRQRMLVLLMGLKSAEERLAAFLLGVSLRFRDHGYPSHRFRLVMSRTDIGSYLGLAKETVSRVLAGFQRGGMLQLRGKNIEIVDINELAGRAQAVRCVLDPVSPTVPIGN